jgi:acetoin utilization protein AcuC
VPGRAVPSTLTDGGDTTFTPWQPEAEGDQLDRAIMAARKAVFPLHGLDPHDPRD